MNNECSVSKGNTHKATFYEGIYLVVVIRYCIHVSSHILDFVVDVDCFMRVWYCNRPVETFCYCCLIYILLDYKFRNQLYVYIQRYCCRLQ